MKRVIRYIVVMISIAVVVSLQGSLMAYEHPSCLGKATGGGWFSDETTGYKCTFGFNAQFRADPNIVAKGQMQFVDHGTGQKIHIAEMQSIEVNEGHASFTGTDKDDNLVTVEYIDAGELGSLGVGDWINITRNDQVWSGDIQGGNIQTRIDEDYPSQLPGPPSGPISPGVEPEPSAEPYPALPGFEVVFAIASLLAVVYLVQRQKRA